MREILHAARESAIQKIADGIMSLGDGRYRLSGAPRALRELQGHAFQCGYWRGVAVGCISCMSIVLMGTFLKWALT